MSLVSVTDIIALGHASTSLTWSGAGYTYVNGEFISGPDTDGADIPYPIDEVIALEVHDCLAPQTIHPVPELHPLLRWTKVTGADAYRVYHTAPSSAEAVILDIPHNSGVAVYAVRCSLELAAGWHLFRVESVVENVESTVDSWAYLVRDIPDELTDMVLTGTAGTFTLTLTE